MQKCILTTLLATALALAQPTKATNSISGGHVTNLTYKDAFFVFQVQANGTNSCAPCPIDPVGLYAGGYCWISATVKGEVSLLVTADVHHIMLSGRVESLSSDCTMYQMALQNRD